jgi:hypothetical protein
MNQIKLTALQAQDVLYKISVLQDETDLQHDYNLTQAQADQLLNSIPRRGGAWNVPDFALEAVRGELTDYADQLRSSIAVDARSGGTIGQALAVEREASELSKKAEALNETE